MSAVLDHLLPVLQLLAGDSHCCLGLAGAAQEKSRMQLLHGRKMCANKPITVHCYYSIIFGYGRVKEFDNLIRRSELRKAWHDSTHLYLHFTSHFSFINVTKSDLSARIQDLFYSAHL
jgi:hypothetical protein